MFYQLFNKLKGIEESTGVIKESSPERLLENYLLIMAFNLL